MCPGVILVGIGSGAPRLVVFAVAMVVGMVAFGLWERRRDPARRPRRESPAEERGGLGGIALEK